MIRNQKQMFIVIGVFVLTLLLGTVTFAFFNYTRTGSANVVRTGRIAFNSEQGTSINLTNVFPIDVTNGIPSNNPNVGSVTINVTGDTTYGEGLEYKVSAVNVTNTVGNKSLPISISVSVESNTNNDPSTTLGTADSDYFTNRGPSANTSIYKVLASDVIEENEELLVGYIKPGATGIDGNIVIKAYLDASKIAISDTYPEETIHTVKTDNYSSSDCETTLTGVTNASTYCASASTLQSAIDNNNLTSVQITLLVNAGIVEEYTNGTTSTWVHGRTVLTTEEWNSLQATGVSFQVKVEANEGTWVEEPVVQTAAGYILANATLETTPYGKIYTGANPANYVTFNGESWRIIGVYGDKLKIVKTTPLEDKQKWQNSTEEGNTWNGSLLETYLNTTYYNSLSGTAKDMIAEGSWDVGVCGYEVAASAAYTCAHETTLTGADINSNRVKVGLIASYEYLYAAENDGACWTQAGDSYDGYGGLTDCKAKDWLFPTLTTYNNTSSFAWTLGPNSVLTHYALYVHYDGFVYSHSVLYDNAASPVVYLKSDVTITGGNGESPQTAYTLSYTAS